MKNRGFTLLELLIALALVGLILMLLYGALHFASRAWDSAEARLDRDTRITALWHYLGDRLRRTRAVQAWVPDARRSDFLFHGETEALEFVTDMPAQLGAGGLYILRLQPVARHGRRALLLRRWFYHPEVLSGEAGVPPWRPLGEAALNESGLEKPGLRAWYSESVLVEDLREVRFEYFGPPQPGDSEGDWLERWEDRNRLPWLVRLRVTDRQGAWPAMTFGLPGGGS